MSRWPLVWLAACVATPGLQAQRAPAPALGRPTPRTEQLEARADTLLRQWRAATQLAAVAGPYVATRPPGSAVTVAIGALRVVTNPSPLPVRAAAIRVWATIDSTYGTAASALSEHPYYLQAIDPDTSVPRPDRPWGVLVPWNVDTATLARILLSGATTPEADPALLTWMGGRIDLMADAALGFRSSYVDVVTSPFQVSRQCFLGAVDRCALALGLIDPAAGAVQLLLTPTERRDAVDRLRWQFAEGSLLQDRQACMAGVDSTCVHLLGIIPAGEWPKPLGNRARQSLVRVALRLGGSEAFARLMQDPAAPLSDRLQRASGVRVDSLLATWRSLVVRARPEPVTIPVWGVWAALAWGAIFAGLAIRSSRWRLS